LGRTDSGRIEYCMIIAGWVELGTLNSFVIVASTMPVFFQISARTVEPAPAFVYFSRKFEFLVSQTIQWVVCLAWFSWKVCLNPR
jgi:hypothetical protein